VVASLGFWFIKEEPRMGHGEAPEALRAFLGMGVVLLFLGNAAGG
jgi:hypothetical protein